MPGRPVRQGCGPCLGCSEHAARQYDLGRLRRISTVVVTVAKRANVLLMTASNYRSYVAGRRYKYIGGEARTSPTRLTFPAMITG